jgi:alpha-methylacyl-CoA racemase
MGILAAILEARQSGEGQVVDAAIVDGTASLMTSFFGLHAAGIASLERGSNTLDSGAYYYDVYECSDGQWVSVAPIEGRFYAELLKIMEISPEELGDQRDRNNWTRAKTVLAAKFRCRTRDEWCQLFNGSDACFAPVLTMAEAPEHPHLAARGTFIDIDGVKQPAPAPRFSRSVPDKPTGPEAPDGQRALEGWLSEQEISSLQKAGVI